MLLHLQSEFFFFSTLHFRHLCYKLVFSSRSKLFLTLCLKCLSLTLSSSYSAHYVSLQHAVVFYTGLFSWTLHAGKSCSLLYSLLYFRVLCPLLSCFLWKPSALLFVASAANRLFWPPQIPMCHLWIEAAKIIFSSRFSCHAAPTPRGFLYSSTSNSSTLLWKVHVVVPSSDTLHPFALPMFLPWSKTAFESPSC